MEAVASLAKSLKMASTAEGVETRQQREMLQSIGCTDAGLSISRARPASEIRQYFDRGQAGLTGAA